MMKNSSLLKWTNNRLSTKNNKNANKNWIHPPEALQSGHIAYLVKFLGSTEVSQPKGIDIVKEAIRKLKFSQQIKKSEGNKIAKVDLTISVDGVAIQQPKSKKILSQYPLHRISYCADDKAEKRFFSFIAKEADRDAHTCFVFVSDKLAEEITLTIGQAFDLAYRRFLETSSRELELRRQIASLQHQLHSVQTENTGLKSRLKHVASLKNRPDLDSFMEDNNISDISAMIGDSMEDSNSNGVTLLTEVEVLPTDLPPVPPRNFEKNISSPLVIDDLLSSQSPEEESDDEFDPRADEKSPSLAPPLGFNGHDSCNGSQEDDGSDQFDPRADEIRPTAHSSPSLELNGLSPIPSLLPPPPPPRNQTSPFDSVEANDPFGFPSSPSDDVLAKFNEMKVGFSQGLTFGTTEVDFTLDSLDPLKN